MTSKGITSALTAAQALFLPIDGQPSNKDLVRLSNVILSILLKATYDRINSIHNLWGLVAGVDCYLHHYSAPFVCPAIHPACYDPTIKAEASCINCICTKTAWAALIQDYEAHKAAECSIKVYIGAVVNNLWICNLRNPKMFYSNVTALTIFDHLRKRSGGLQALDMVLLTIQMN
jgi:hypothetical protein